MKVICKNCGKRYNFDLYMGMCPKCSTFYREEATDHTGGGDSAGKVMRQEEKPAVPRKEPAHGKSRGLDNTYKGQKQPKHGIVYSLITLFIVLSMFAGAVVPFFCVRMKNASGRADMELDENWEAEEIAVGDPVVYSTEQGDYQVIITGAKADKRKKLDTPEHYQTIAVSYEIQPPKPVEEEMSWSDNPPFFGIYLYPYLITKSGEYLEPLYSFELAEKMGWGQEKQGEMGLSDRFTYAKGVIYFLAKKGDVEGLWINSFNYDEKNSEIDTLRGSFEITGLEVKK